MISSGDRALVRDVDIDDDFAAGEGVDGVAQLAGPFEVIEVVGALGESGHHIRRKP
ncbi:MAG: hypothetical protein R3D52_11015 [Xanthobacteraceae bacterium]